MLLKKYLIYMNVLKTNPGMKVRPKDINNSITSNRVLDTKGLSLSQLTFDVR